MGDRRLHPLRGGEDVAFKCSSPFSNPWSSREADTSGPWLSLVFHARASSCSPAGMLPLPQPSRRAPVSLGSNLSHARFAASWYHGVTPCKFMPWLNVLRFYSNNHVLEGTSSLESEENRLQHPRFAFGWFLQWGCPIACPCFSSAGAVPGWSRPAPGFPCKLQMCLMCGVKRGVSSGLGKH